VDLRSSKCIDLHVRAREKYINKILEFFRKEVKLFSDYNEQASDFQQQNAAMGNRMNRMLHNKNGCEDIKIIFYIYIYITIYLYLLYINNTIYQYQTVCYKICLIGYVSKMPYIAI